MNLFNLQKPETKDEIMFQYCFPRLDVNVTKGLNHLLKSPFCVHPKTGGFVQAKFEEKQFCTIKYRVHTGPGNPGKSWNFTLAFFRTEVSWKMTASPGKSWRPVFSQGLLL